MGIKDLEKKRSQFAYKCVSEIWNEYKELENKAKEKKLDCKKDENKNIPLCEQLKEKYKLAGNYKSYVKKIPMMILNNGLGATFAFIYSKKEKEKAYKKIYLQINNWLKEQDIKSGICDDECYKKEKNKNCKDIDLVEWIICLNSQEYRVVTNEVLALFNWLKRFADGMIEGDDNG